jgi:four helix bundle protein
MATFDHEKLDVYNISLDFVVLADGLVDAFPKGRAYLGDQLHRAATSIALNIAEGAGEFSRKEKARIYRIGLRSATESAALLDVARRLSIVDEKVVAGGRDLLIRVVSMLTRMVRNLGEH